jgi:2-oxoglutarate dehydrogenase E1 component
VSEKKITNISEFLAENFGANATYVEGLLARFKSDPNLVDESWRNYFTELLNGASLVPQAASDNRQTTTQTIQTATTQITSATATAPQKEVIAAALGAGVEAKPILGGAKKIVENMEESLTVPTATSTRRIPVKVLEENRRIINEHLQKTSRGKASFTHLIAWAIVRALQDYPRLNDGYQIVNGMPSRLERDSVNLGVAVDVEKKDGSRTLFVPNIKGADKMNFAQFLDAYNDVVNRARNNQLTIPDFQGTTVSLTNPGTIGTVASNPRLMNGQSIIIATGAIEYPAEYQAMTEEALSQLGIGKVVTVSSTYDHRIIQGAESGMLLARVHEYLIGKHDFYDKVFADLSIKYHPYGWATDKNPIFFGGDRTKEYITKEARVLELINAYRVRGHLIADIDPLDAMEVQRHPELDIETYGLTIWDLDREFITGGLNRKESSTLREILEVLRKAYCGKVGVEYRHITSKEQKTWIRDKIRDEFVNPQPIPTEVRKELLLKLIEAEQFEKFLHTKYLGQKRFSLEGCETIIPLLDQLVEGASARGVEDITFGMAHRGRLNVLSNVIGDYAERVFTAFEGTAHPEFPADEGDVKYHQGAKNERSTRKGKKIRITLSPNPSHLEFVDPVVEGIVRAKQDTAMAGDVSRREQVIDQFLPVLLHGDAAFAGQGIVMETLQLADLKGYRTGGTIHIIINNQIGFTTGAESARSSIYSTDVARMTQLPIFHINGDDPEAAYRTMQIALDFRQEFNKDVCLDVVGFRKLGHNEGDEPSYTQPLMYARVKAHPGVRQIYEQQLLREGVLTEDDAKKMHDEVVGRYEEILKRAKKVVAEKEAKAVLPDPILDEDGSAIIETPTDLETIKTVSQKISLVPEGFHVNPKMVGQLARRAKMGEGEMPMDWAFGEAMAFGSLVLEGYIVRLSGQDSGRGTFSQRHAIMYDTQTGESWMPLSELRCGGKPEAQFHVYDSNLSEQGVLGFEYGYSVIEQDALVMWEAQFGDFSNGAQVIIDQYIAASEDKWKQYSRLVMLLPHGYEGQGPEHSSARLERYLQLCAENNLQVCYPTTPAQYFHLLRRQVKQEVKRPLIVMTPKSLLRLPAASSTIAELTSGGFQPVLDDAQITDKSNVTRIVLCSGKVYYDLEAERKKLNENRVAILRLEQFYPFPKARLQEIVSSYPNAKELFWCQEEPKNMGGWTFVSPRLLGMYALAMTTKYAGRHASASPATGSYSIHELEQKQLVTEALTL